MAMGYRVPRPLVSCPPLDMSVLAIDYHGYLRFCPDLANYRDAADDSTDIIADLNLHSLTRSLKLLANRIALFRRHKINDAVEGELTAVDSYPCYYCLGYFNKADALDIP